MTIARHDPSSGPASGRAVAVVSVHASPLGDLGRGENGGMNLAIRRLCQGLAERGVPTDVFVRRDDPAAPAEELLGPGSRLVRLAAGPARPLPKQELLNVLPAFTRALLEHAESERRRYRLVHAHYWLSIWSGRRAAQRWGVPLVASFHTLARLKESAGLPADPSRAEVEAVLARSADRLVAMSTAEERALVDLYGADADRICVVPPGVDLDERSPRPTCALRTRLGLRDRRVVLYAGRLEPLKGVDLLLAASRRLARESDLDDVTVLVAGADSQDGTAQSEHPGGERGRLEALAAELGVAQRVRFLGPVPHDELGDLLAMADLVVVPSMTETFGLVALEAQASGTPVVAARVGGLVDAVDDGVTGVLVAGRDPAVWSSAIAGLLRDDVRRRRMGDAGRRHAESFTWDRSTDRLLHLFDCVEQPEAAPLEACACR